MKFLVLGHGGHGKGTFCKMIEEVHGLKSLSSSKAAWPLIWPSVYEARALWYNGLDDNLTPEVAYQQRSKYRPLLKELILLLNRPNLTTLTKIVLEQADIYDGMRSIDEFNEAREMFDVILWVDGFMREGVDPSMEIPYDDQMIRIDNNGTEKDLLEKVKNLFKFINSTREQLTPHIIPPERIGLGKDDPRRNQ